ncbi:hypothetical protein [Rubrimonas cliftonensis]|uniref:hypothetical protein n=1 Tax=Rubrimonas cliftonensis TaxID=89524 RepID=UPI000B876036|nr:hypothetical protein [Rubrimonas cliftonensis]
MARAVRAALDRGFGLVGVWAMERELSRIEAEAVIGRLARQALAETEALRALPCARSEADIATAKSAHAQTAAAWRDALRRNDLAALAPALVGAAADLGIAAPETAAAPALLRETARTFVAVAEENIAREDGVYAGDVALLRRVLDITQAPCVLSAPSFPDPATARPTTPIGAPVSSAPPPISVCLAPKVELRTATALRPVASGEGANTAAGRSSDDAGPARAARREPEEAVAVQASGAPASSDGPGASAIVAACDIAVVEPAAAAIPPSGSTLRLTGAKPATARRRRGTPTPKLARRGVSDPHVEMLRRLEGEALWDITVTDAFALARHHASKGGNNTSWLSNSARSFDKAAEMAASYFQGTKLRDIKTVDCEDWRDLVIDLPTTHGKAKEYSGELKDIVAHVNDKEDRLLTELEECAAKEGWSVDRLLDAEAEIRIKRLAPRTCYKHQSYLSQVFNTIVDLSGTGRNAMTKAMWSKAYTKQLIAEAGAKRVAWGEQDRRRLFGTALHCAGPDHAADALFWSPLMKNYMGGRMEEVCQIHPGDVTQEDGVPVFDIKAGPGQKLKSVHSPRKLPIHPELIRIGIVRLAAHRKSIGARTLFDVERALDGSFSTRFSKLFHKWRRENGIYMAGKDAHSLRKDFYQSLKSGGVDYAARIVLMGHGLNDVSETNYGHREWKMTQLRDFISTIPNDTAHIRPVI